VTREKREGEEEEEEEKKIGNVASV